MSEGPTLYSRLDRDELERRLAFAVDELRRTNSMLKSWLDGPSFNAPVIKSFERRVKAINGMIHFAESPVSGIRRREPRAS